MTTRADTEKKAAALAAVDLISDGQIVGLGTGSTAEYAIHEIARRGLKISTVPTSARTAKLAASLGIPVVDINDVEYIDITLDGADEFTESLQLIKGGGNAFLREKIVASRTRKEIIMADSSKLVRQLGKFKLPIEVIPYARVYVMQQLQQLGATVSIRAGIITDEGNIVMDADFGLISHPEALATSLDKITGLVDHGLFLDIAAMVLMGEGEEVIIYTRK